jgi:hypothetical protein
MRLPSSFVGGQVSSDTFGCWQISLSSPLNSLRKVFDRREGLEFHPPTLEFGWFSVEQWKREARRRIIDRSHDLDSIVTR